MNIETHATSCHKAQAGSLVEGGKATLRRLLSPGRLKDICGGPEYTILMVHNLETSEISM